MICTLDYLRHFPKNLDKAKAQFGSQAKGMIEAYQHYFGEYPFIRDGYKLVEAPYTGMEHQSAVTYGNGFRNGFVGRGQGAGTKFDFIIIHESAHEWLPTSNHRRQIPFTLRGTGRLTWSACTWSTPLGRMTMRVKYTNSHTNPRFKESGSRS